MRTLIVRDSASVPRWERSRRRAGGTGRATRTRPARRDSAFRVSRAARDRPSRPVALLARGRPRSRGSRLARVACSRCLLGAANGMQPPIQTNTFSYLVSAWPRCAGLETNRNDNHESLYLFATHPASGAQQPRGCPHCSSPADQSGGPLYLRDLVPRTRDEFGATLYHRCRKAE